MNITELNKKLKQAMPADTDIARAEVKGYSYNTFFYNNLNDEVAKLDDDNDFQTNVGEYVSMSSLGLIKDYANTPLKERLTPSEKKYNLIIFQDFSNGKDYFDYLTAIKKGENCDGSFYTDNSSNKCDLNNHLFQFTQKEIDKMIENRPEYKNIILKSMKEVND